MGGSIFSEGKERSRHRPCGPDIRVGDPQKAYVRPILNHKKQGFPQANFSYINFWPHLAGFVYPFWFALSFS